MALPDWSALPADAISAISTHIADDADYVRFRSVCTSFRSAAPKRPQLPCLLQAHHIDKTLNLQFFYFPNAVPSTAPRLPEDLAAGRFLCGTSRGWIALLDDAPGISLHNPFTAARLDLPPLTNLPWVHKSEYFITNCDIPFRNLTAALASKLILSSHHPTAADNIVLAVSNFGTSLICCRPGDACWTLVPPFLASGHKIDDIVYYKHKFYAVRGYTVFFVDIGPEFTNVYQILPIYSCFSNGKELAMFYPNRGSYLVVSSGNLLLVSNMRVKNYGLEGDVSHHVSFEVFMVDLDFSETINGQLSLSKMDNVGGCSLFVGSYGSMSVSAGTSPLCRGNCIYVIYKSDWAQDTIYVYCMEDGLVSRVTDFDSSVDWDFNWFAPRLC